MSTGWIDTYVLPALPRFCSLAEHPSLLIARDASEEGDLGSTKDGLVNKVSMRRFPVLKSEPVLSGSAFSVEDQFTCSTQDLHSL